MRALFAAALAALALPTSVRADQTPPPGQTNTANDTLFGALDLGRREGGKTTLTPDALQIRGAGSTGDVSGMSVAPSGSAAAGTLSKLLGDLGSQRIFVSASGLMSGLTGANIAGSPGTTLFVRPAVNLANGAMLYSADDSFSTPKGLELIGSTIKLEPTEAVTILPTPGSYAQALNIVQSGPKAGTHTNQFNFNKLDVSFSSKVAGTGGIHGLEGSGTVSAFQVSLNVGGPNFDAMSAFGGSFGLNQTRPDTSGADKVGLSGGIYASASTKGNLYGASAGLTLVDGGYSPSVYGFESDSLILGTGATPVRFGINSVNQGEKRATKLDAAYGVGSNGLRGTYSGSFGNLIALYNATGINPPGRELPAALGPTASFFISDHALSVSHFANLPNVAITGNILSFPGVVLTGAGKLTTSGADLYASAPRVPSGHVGYGGTTVAASRCGSLPGSAGCLVINVGGTQRYVPFY